MTLDTGQVVDNRYRIVKLLGQGGMGAVYRAWDMRLNRAIALKEMIPQFGLDASMLGDLREQFRQEAQVLATLVHPNLVRVTDYFSWDGNEYLVMDFVEGEDLAGLIAREGAQEEAQVLGWAGQLLDALAYCHKQGVIHRDIKPQNIIITPEGQAVLVDFGLVKLWDPSDPQTRTVMRGAGTPEYAPPEQYDMGVGHTDQRSDVYSVGATLYHALTGKLPPTATQRMASPACFQAPRHANEAVSANTEAVVLKALEMAMGKRYQSAEEMSRALGAAPRVTGVVTPARAKLERRRAASAAGGARPPKQRRGVLLGMGGAGLAVVGVLCLLLAAVVVVVGTGVLDVDPTAVPTSTSVPTSTPRPTQTPTPVPTSTPEPTSTPIPTLDALPDRETYVSEGGGFSIDYPGAWTYFDEEGLFFLSSEDMDSTGEGAVVFVMFSPVDDPDVGLWEWWSQATEEWDASEVTVGEPEPLTLDGVDALFATIEDDEAYGWLIVAISNDYTYVFLIVVTPTDIWSDYEDVFVAMLESVQFFPPE
jgi:eukaryotic-like serine/threonine-protein kinase